VIGTLVIVDSLSIKCYDRYIMSDQTNQTLGRRKRLPDQTREAAEQATRADILRAATKEFVAKGYDGASISSITKHTQTSQRMLYYHFSDKYGLYCAVLEAGYKRMFADTPLMEQDVQDPLLDLRQFAERTFDRHIENEDFVRLIMIENIAGAMAVQGSETAKTLSKKRVGELYVIIERGKAEGVFRADLDASDVYGIIAGLSFSAVSNRHTVNALFGSDLSDETEKVNRRNLTAQAACRFASP